MFIIYYSRLQALLHDFSKFLFKNLIFQFWEKFSSKALRNAFNGVSIKIYNNNNTFSKSSSNKNFVKDNFWNYFFIFLTYLPMFLIARLKQLLISLTLHESPLMV